MKFHINQLITVATGIFCCTKFSDVSEILMFMTQDKSLTTHQIPRFLDECEPYIKEQHPFLREYTSEMLKKNPKLLELLEEAAKKHGEYHTVIPIHQEDHETIGPYQELLDMGIDPDNIIT